MDASRPLPKKDVKAMCPRNEDHPEQSRGDRFDLDPISPRPLGLTKSEWDSFKAECLSSPERRQAAHQEWQDYHRRRRERWEAAGYDLDWTYPPS